uniref:PKS_ER domain-containing protein n=1 Tax=Rhabditophanes sp. KR3021 TaxID=114890 RepID=A0AC35TUQ5_9BILA
MKAAVVSAFGASKNIQIINDYPLPLIKDDEVLVEVKFAGLNPVDTYIRSGQYAALPKLPYIPGREGSGIVSEIGEKCPLKLSIGDRVWFSSPLTGSCAEYCAAKFVFRVPDNCGLKESATLGIAYATAYRSLFLKAHLKEEDVVLIHGGSGGVGVAAIQLAKSVGAIVIGTAGSEEGLKMMVELGCQDTFDHTTADYISLIKQKYPAGFNVIIEMLANANLNNDLDLIGKKGTIVVVGNRGQTTIDARRLMAKESILTGVGLAHSTDQELIEMGNALTSHLKEKTICPKVSHVFELEKLSAAHDTIMDNNVTKTGKIVIQIM